MSPDVQWYGFHAVGPGPYPESELEPHRRLWLRVWWRAVCDYVLYRGRTDSKSRRLADDAAGWLFGLDCHESCPSECEESSMSFEGFCEEFNLSPARIRSWVMNLTASEINMIGRNLP